MVLRCALKLLQFRTSNIGQTLLFSNFRNSFCGVIDISPKKLKKILQHFNFLESYRVV